MDPEKNNQILNFVEKTLHLVCIELPYLSGLACYIRFFLDDERTETIGIFPSGRMVINPDWFGAMNIKDATFILAHELLHLALRTHERSKGESAYLFNCAHDYIINDMLKESLNHPIPANGLKWDGARNMSLEKIVSEMKRCARSIPEFLWENKEKSGATTEMAVLLKEAGLLPPSRAGSQNKCDVLPSCMEKEWFPEASPIELDKLQNDVEKAGRKALELKELSCRIESVLASGRGTDSGDCQELVNARRTMYVPPWSLALQKWIENAGPATRTYIRPSRRQVDSDDIVLAGRKREGWTLHIILDTSGSMCDEFSRILGIIASFCNAMNVEQFHIVQCDTEVAKDEWISPDQIQNYNIQGMGGSDLSPALLSLAKNQQVKAAIVLTDGNILYPEEPMPYKVLWVLTFPNYLFVPSYGQVIYVHPSLS